jgi:hypothetical protein
VEGTPYDCYEILMKQFLQNILPKLYESKMEGFGDWMLIQRINMRQGISTLNRYDAV